MAVEAASAATATNAAAAGTMHHLPPKHLLPRPPGASLYVGDLHPTVTQADLFEAFRGMGHVVSVRVCYDAYSGKSLCYGYVNFLTDNEAQRAMACLNHRNLKGKPMRIMTSQRDPLRRKTGIGNLYVKNLAPSISSARLQSLFLPFGTILSCKVAEDNGKSKGFGFVQFESEESAMSALNGLNDTLVEGKKLYVGKFMRKSERMAMYQNPIFTSVYVKNLGGDTTEDSLLQKFSQFGKILNVVIMKDPEGKSKGFGFVNYETHEAAARAVESMNGSSQGSKTLYVGRAQKKSERQLIKVAQTDTVASYHAQQNASNLYVKNLDKSIDDLLLEDHFSSFGRIISARVIHDSDGSSRGYGFVCFATSEEARRALDVLNGTIFRGKRLHVAMAHPKENRFRTQQYYPSLFPAQVMQSSYWNASSYYFPPYFNYSVSPLSQTPVSPPLPYYDLRAITSSPFATENHQKSYPAHVLQEKRPMHDDNSLGWGYNVQSARCAASTVQCKVQERAPHYLQRFGFKKKDTRHSHAETSSAKTMGARRKNPPNRMTGSDFYPSLENIKPEHDWNVAGDEDGDIHQIPTRKL